MTNAKSLANMLHQMAKLANELEAQGAEIIGVSFDFAGRYLHLSGHDLPASIAERGVNRECHDEYDEVFYTDASGVCVRWFANRENSND